MAIQREKMNILYKAIDNPIQIVVEKLPLPSYQSGGRLGEKKLVTSSRYFIYTTDNGYSIKETPIIGINKWGPVCWIYRLEYRLKRISGPVPTVAQKTGGTVEWNKLSFFKIIYLQLIKIEK